MRLATVAVPLRAAGLTVVEHVGWKALGYGGRDLDAVRGVMWHHTATPSSAQGDYPTATYIIAGSPESPLAQIGLGRSGAVHLLAAGRCNHAGRGSWPGLTGNGDCIGVEMESPGDGSWTSAQKAAMPVLGAVLSREFDVPAALHIAHREWAPTRKSDPAGVDMPTLRGQIARLLTDAPEPEDDMYTDTDRQIAADRHTQIAGELTAQRGRLAALQAAVVAQAASSGVDPAKVEAAIEAAVSRALDDLRIVSAD